MMNFKNYFIILIVLFSTAGFTKNSIPEWAKGAVWYQILPERYLNANTSNDPVKERVVGKDVKDWQVHPWASDWYKLQIWEIDRGLDFNDLILERRYGGDIFGVIEKLKYLKELGVDVIYLNPIFEAPSIRKNDVSTFHHVDNNFGADRDGDWDKIISEKDDPKTWTLTKSDEAFLELVEKAHDIEMKIVIEVDFNYCGREFWAFKDLEENQQNSAYKDWFEVISWDDPATPDTIEFDYKSWQNDGRLPLFKKDKGVLAEPVKKYIFDITRRWMDPNSDRITSDGIDGWFINSAEELSVEFWKEWNQLVKSLNPEALTVAEFRTEQPDWITKNNFDSITNYSLAKTIRNFFVDPNNKIAVAEFNEQLESLRKVYPEEINHTLINLINSHKTGRLSSLLLNPDRSYSNGTNSNNNHDHSYDPGKPNKQHLQIQQLIVLFQLTYIGAPMIIFGDECGMWRGENIDYLKPMLWKEFVFENETYNTVNPDLNEEVEVVFNQELYNHYQLLNKIRHENPALQKGDFKSLIMDDQKNIYAFLRKFENDEVCVILNNSENKQIIDFTTPWKNSTKVKDLLNGRKYNTKDGKIKLDLKKKWGVILVKD